MSGVNDILDRCLVEDESHCLKSAAELLPLVERQIKVLPNAGPFTTRLTPMQSVRRGRICGGKGCVEGESLYDPQTRHLGAMYTEFYVCNLCGHLQQFRTKRPM
jgi:hypothetical protein